jgi:hypothetical protein
MIFAMPFPYLTLSINRWVTPMVSVQQSAISYQLSAISKNKELSNRGDNP